MSRISSIFFVSLTALMAVCISSPVWATTPPPVACVDVEKTCTDAASPTDPIVFEVNLSNCGAKDLWCGLRETGTGNVLYNGPLAVGESVSFLDEFYPGECGETTNEVRAYCVYQTDIGTKGNVYDEDSATCSVPCEGDSGCTLTQGYWKTHSAYGPAPYDATWAVIGEDTMFFLSGMSYYNVLWQEPSGGNAYFVLAHQYIAAQLNVIAGASIPPDVAAAFSTATDLLGLYTPEFIDELRGRDSLRKQFVKLAEMLDDYNRGATGPGHCDDDANGDGGTCD